VGEKAGTGAHVLPGILLDRLASFQDCPIDFGQVGRSNGTGKAQKIAPWNSRGSGETACELQDLLLTGGIEAAYLPDDFVLERPRHLKSI
jgi:hypothetical protein